MSDPSPVYKNPLEWWSVHLRKMEEIIDYKLVHGLTVLPSDYAMLDTARRYVTDLVTEKLTNGENDEN